MSSGHAHGHVSNTEKTRMLPGKLLHWDFFHWFNILIHILITRCIDFVSFLKGQILREFQNIKKFVIFWKNMILKKECIAIFLTLALIEIRRKRLDLMKNRVSFSI